MAEKSDHSELIDAIDDFRTLTVMVVGDIMLDEYLIGEVTRISPEAPVPVLKVTSEKYVLGGAGNTANNIVSLGGRIIVVGGIGNDEAGRRVLALLKEHDTSGIIQTGQSTIRKIRCMAQKHQIVRLDYEENRALTPVEEEKALVRIKSNITKCDVIVISDYGKGFLTPKIITEVVKAGKQLGKKVIVDPKPQNGPYYKGCFLITPNKGEAIGLSGLDGKDSLKMGTVLSKKFSCNILLTLSEHGMVLFDGNSITEIPTIAKEVSDVSGAGDTVVAAMALGTGAGLSLKDSAVLANHAAGICVSKVGTAIVSPEELKRSLIEE